MDRCRLSNLKGKIKNENSNHWNWKIVADPKAPATWRQIAKTAGTGSLGDLTAHIISLSDMIAGKRIAEVFASWDIVYAKRPDSLSYYHDIFYK